jgi:heme-degrading monooxygenase HmoA
MSIIKINAITVAEDSGDELARRFAARAGAVDDADGFEGFELFQPTDGRTVWLVVTRWRDEQSFAAWSSSPAFGRGHRSEGSGSGPSSDAGSESARESESESESAEAPRKPVGVSSELWSFVVAGGSRP